MAPPRSTPMPFTLVSTADVAPRTAVADWLVEDRDDLETHDWATDAADRVLARLRTAHGLPAPDAATGAFRASRAG